MRLRLPVRLRQWLGRRSAKGLVGLSLAGLIGLLLIGGGVYAAFGGFGEPVSISDVELQRGLVGLWKLNGNAKDSTPYGDNGAASNVTATTDRKDAANAAYAFNGSSSTIGLGNPSQLNFERTNKMSFSTWLKTTSGGVGVVVSKITNSNPYTGYEFGISNGHPYLFLINNYGAGNYLLVYANQTVNNGTWHHVTVTYDGSSSTSGVNFYIDGVLVANYLPTNSLSASIISSTPIQIGSRNNTAYYFNGSLADIRIYNRALSAAEVKVLASQYNAQTNLANGENGLVGWWKLNGNTKDATPYSDNASVVNGPTPTTDREGVANSAYSFNGTNQYMAATYNSIFNVGQPGLTVSAWIKPTSLSGTYVVVERNAPFLLWIDGPNKRLYTGLYAGGNWYWAYSSTNSLSVGQWQHIAMTYDGTSRKLYVNGVQSGVSDTQVTGNLNVASANLYIGYDQGGGGRYYFPGSISDVRLYNRALSPSEINALANSYNSQINLNSSPTTQQTVNLNSGLVGYWPFNGNAKDMTPYQRNGTVNGVTLTTDRKGRANSAYSFNGTSTSYIATTGQFSLPTNNVSVSAWVNLANTSTNGMIVEKETVNSQWELFIESSNLRWVGGLGYNASVICPGVMTAGVWHHVVGTQNGTTATLYLDGVQCTTATQPVITNGSGYLSIGKYNGGYYFKGSIDDVRVYNRALSATEVQTLYSNYY